MLLLTGLNVMTPVMVSWRRPHVEAKSTDLGFRDIVTEWLEN